MTGPVAVTVLAAALAVAPLAGQSSAGSPQRDDSAARPVRRWHIVVSRSKVTTPGSWRTSLIAAFPPTTSCGDWGCQTYPHYSGSGGDAFVVSAGYRARPWLEVRGTWIGATGLGAVLWSGGQETDGRVSALAGLVALTPGPLRLGAGPAVYSVSLSQGAGGGTKVGWMWEVGLRFPQRSRVLVDLAVQRRVAGEVAMAATPTQSVSGSFSHTAVQLGLGVRW